MDSNLNNLAVLVYLYVVTQFSTLTKEGLIPFLNRYSFSGVYCVEYSLSYFFNINTYNIYNTSIHFCIVKIIFSPFYIR